MAITGPIPLPNVGASLDNLFAQLRQAQQNKIANQLIQAQTKEAQNKSALQQYILSKLNGASRQNPSPAPEQSNQPQSIGQQTSLNPLQAFKQAQQMQSYPQTQGPMPLTMQNQSPLNQYSALQSMFQNRGQPQQIQSQVGMSPQEEIQQYQPKQSNNGIGHEVEVNPGNPAKAGYNDVAGLEGFPAIRREIDNNGNLITYYPDDRITMTKIGQNAGDKAKAEEAGKKDIDYAATLNERIPEIVEMQGTVKAMADITQDPIWQNMYKRAIVAKDKGPDWVRTANMAKFKAFGTKQERDLIGQFQTNVGNLMQEAASKFKGSFRVGEQKLIDNMKAGINDPIDVQIGKLKQFGRALDLEQKLNSRISELVIDDGLSQTKATKIAMRELKVDKFREDLEKSLSKDSGNNVGGIPMSINGSAENHWVQAGGKKVGGK